MKYQERKPAVLVLEDGSVYYGKAIGTLGTATGEICFNTGMTGYQEIFTDPSYFGQILVSTVSHIGNYGIHNDEIESSDLNIAGLVCKKFTDQYYSRSSAAKSIQEYFEELGLSGISDVDTRAIVRHIRDSGAMNAIISSEELDVEILKTKVKEIPSMAGLELSSKVATKEPYLFGDENAEFKVAVLDLGVKRSILSCLADRGCYLKVFPMNTSIEDMTMWSPDGFMLSNGPGDPSAMSDVIETVKRMTELEIPIFGICLGHQVLSLASGLTTRKMHNGHRGVNHPVINLQTGKCEVTSQNHGFVVEKESLSNNSDIEITHTHLNDNTLAGIKFKNKKIFSVQYHPEASAGPHDSRYLFDDFIANISEMVKRNKAVVS
ncbi:MAG: glutamine-hydrolyzing carbamoyl-phosphate synthase small subunit [Flavobacteriales bacterium]|nr:glutamine-hydrolyzing carbamoyl-phosphate synthase small subunit [Flavobacteriales bacterium]